VRLKKIYFLPFFVLEGRYCASCTVYFFPRVGFGALKKDIFFAFFSSLNEDTVPVVHNYIEKCECCSGLPISLTASLFYMKIEIFVNYHMYVFTVYV
jgi:hypothetical protein